MRLGGGGAVSRGESGFGRIPGGVADFGEDLAGSYGADSVDLGEGFAACGLDQVCDLVVEFCDAGGEAADGGDTVSGDLGSCAAIPERSRIAWPRAWGRVSLVLILCW